VPISLASGAENHVCLWINRLSLTVTTLHRYLAKADQLKHHHKLMLVIPAQPMRPKLRMQQKSLLEDLMTHPDVLHLLDPVGAGGFVNQYSGAVGGAHAGTPETPLPLDPKVSPGHCQGDEEFPARFEMPMKSS
jgi:hypothetical protein